VFGVAVERPNVRQEILVHHPAQIERGREFPIATRGVVVDFLRPRIDDGLALGVRHEADFSARKCLAHQLRELACARVHRRDVVNVAPQGARRRGHQTEQRVDRVRHRHERDACVLADEALVRASLRRRVDHLGQVVAGAAARLREGADQPREADAPKVDALLLFAVGELPVVAREVAAELFAIQLVASVHRRRHRPLRLADLARALFAGEIGQAVDRDAAREQERDLLSVPTRLIVRHFQQVQRPRHVDFVRGLGREFRSRGEQRGEVKDGVNLELADQSFEQVPIQDIADDGRATPLRDRRIDLLDVEREHLVAPELRQFVDEAMPHLSVRSRDQHNRLSSHGRFVAPLVDDRERLTTWRVRVGDDQRRRAGRTSLAAGVAANAALRHGTERTPRSCAADYKKNRPGDPPHERQ
jgi:hypothetical protein